MARFARSLTRLVCGIQIAPTDIAMAPTFLVMFATTHGQARKIAGEIASTLRGSGASVTVGNVVEPWVHDPRDYTSVVVVAPVHGGRFSSDVRQWVRRHRTALASRHSAFVAVCLAIVHRTPKVDRGLREVLERFTNESGWQPAGTKIVAGALKYTQYGWFTRWMMKRIVGRAGGDVDTSRDYEYTDWQDLREFAMRFLRDVNQYERNQGRTSCLVKEFAAMTT